MIDFRPGLNKSLYTPLADLDQMRVDLNYLHRYFYQKHTSPFIGLESVLKNILPPFSSIPQNGKNISIPLPTLI